MQTDFHHGRLGGFLKAYAVVAHELLEHIDVDAVPHVQKRTVADMTRLPVPKQVSAQPSALTKKSVAAPGTTVGSPPSRVMV